MQAIVRHALERLPAPDPAVLAQARMAAARANTAEHERFASQIEALRAIEHRAPRRSTPWTGRFTIAAFNAQRLKNPEAARALLDRAGATVALLSEVDVGMAQCVRQRECIVDVRCYRRHERATTSGSAGVKNGHSHPENRHGPSYAWMNSACWHHKHGLV